MSELSVYGLIFLSALLGIWACRPGLWRSTGRTPNDWSALTPGLARRTLGERLRDWHAKLIGKRPSMPTLETLGIDREFARAAEQTGGRGGIWGVLSVGRKMKLSREQQESLRGRLSYVGAEFQPFEFSGMKICTAVAAVAAALTLGQHLVRSYPVIVALAAVVGFFLPELWLNTGVAKRNKAILRLLPEVMDLLALCMGAGLDFLGALNRVVAVKVGAGSNRKEPLLEELTIVMQEIKFGKRRSEALKAMAKRVSMPEISSFVRTLVQADRMGTPIGEVLATYCEDVRFERYNRAEKAALTAPVKILLPLIFCILPSVAIIVAAPIFLQFSRLNLTGR